MTFFFYILLFAPVSIFPAEFDVLLIQKEGDDRGGDFCPVLHLYFLAGPELANGGSLDERGDFRAGKTLFFLQCLYHTAAAGVQQLSLHIAAL